MPLITLNIPHNKMPIVQEFIQENGLKQKDNALHTNRLYVQNQSSPALLSNSYFTTSRGWEFFINELEFE